jgi:hypothetical protein
LICVLALLGGFYFRKQINSRLAPYASNASSMLSPARDSQPSKAAASPKTQAVSSISGKFTFFPKEKDQYAWSVKYPDGRVFKLSEEFSGDCAPTLKLAKRPETIRIEFNEHRGCKPGSRKPIQVEAESLKDVNADGSPELVAAILTGGNINGHTSSLISLTPKGPKVIRRLD